MAVAGNAGGAGGARNVARAQRRPRPRSSGPPKFPKAVPVRPGATTGRGADVARGLVRTAQRQPRPSRPGPPAFPKAVPKRPGAIAHAPAKAVKLPSRAPATPTARARATERGYAEQGRQVEADANWQRAVQDWRERQRASRVAVSAQRKRTGGEAPIIVRRREKVERQGRGLAELERTAGQRARALIPPKPKRKEKHVGGLIGTALGATELADKLLSGKTTAGLVAGAADIAGKFASGDYARKVSDPIATAILGHKPKPSRGVAKGIERLSRGVGHDIIDLPANAIPSLYVPTKQVVTGHPGQAVKEVYAGAKETLTHPLEHPLGAALTVSGVGGAVGRGAGFAARTGALGEGVRGAAKTAREAKTIPGTRAETRQAYSPDIGRKLVQVGIERRAERRAAKKGQASPKRRMDTGDIQREVDDFVRTSRNVRGRAEEKVAREVGQALHHGKRLERRKPITAAHTVAVQGLANATKADLERLLVETRSAAAHLGGDALRENQRRQEQLTEAIKGHKPETEAHVRETQKRYRPIDKRQEDEMVDLGILDRKTADESRYVLPATRHGLHDPETAPAHERMAKDRRAQASKEKRTAHQARLDANAELRTTVEKTRASELGPRGKRHPDVQKAERDLAKAEQTHNVTHADLKKRVDAAEAELTAARHDAAISTQHVSKTPEVERAQRAVVDARKDLDALRRQHEGSQRGAGRLEGRAQEQVSQANARARGATRTASRDVRRSADEVKTRTKALADLRERGATPKQLEVAQVRLDRSRATHERHVSRLREAQRFEPGTHPRTTLARVERRGGAEVELGQQIAHAQERLDAAELHAAKTLRRFKGVPPRQADRLRNAIVEQARARLARRQREGLADTADAVTQAKGRVAYERSKRGLDPAAAERLWKAMGEAEAATKRHQDAVAAEAQASSHYRDLKAAPFIDREGRPSSVADVAAHPALSGQPEPSFIPGAYERRVAALPEKRINIPNPQGRSGAQVVEGRTPVSPGHLLTARIERERMIEAAKARTVFLHRFGYREGGKADAELARYGTEAEAAKTAGEAEKTTGMGMAPMHNQDGSWSLVPKGALDRLRAHEETLKTDPVERLGRQWRQGVLAFSAKWLAGQAGEGSLRTAIHQGFNPVRLARSHAIVTRTLDELKAVDPEAAARFESLYKRGGAGRTAKQSRDEAFHDFQMGESSGALMDSVQKLQRRPTAQKAGNVYGMWQKFMFDWMNGGIETAVRRGMVGRELLADPIFRDKGIVTDFSTAAKELAEGQRNTPAQNRLARQVDDAFGKYQGRGPAERRLIENVTPFIPWFLSAARFLGVVLPRDHPVLTSLIAASNTATEEWRKKYGLDTDVTKGTKGDETTLPLYKQGSIPSGKGVLNVSHFTPMGATAALGDLGSFLIPQYQDIQAAAKGEDWRGIPLTGRDNPPSLLRIMEALTSAGVTTVAPPLGTAARVLGIHLPSDPDVKPTDVKTTLGQRAKKFINPLARQKGISGGGAEGALKLGAPLQLKGAEPLKSGGLVLK